MAIDKKMMKRILQIISAPASGGAETFVRDLSCTLAGKGHILHVCFIDRAADIGRDPKFEADFLSRLEAYGIGYSFLGHEVRRKPWLGALRLRRLVRKERIDVIHSHLAYGNVFAAAIPFVPLVYTHHNELMRFSRPYWLYFRARVSCFIGISQLCAENLRRYCGDRSTLKLIRNGIDLNLVTQRSPTVADPEAPLRAIAVGRISAQKNYPLLAQALAGLHPTERSRIKVDVYGEGDPSIMRSCFEILREAGADENLLCFRGVSNQVRETLSDYDLFLMSSDWEGLPIALIEATAAGLPVIVTDVGGCREPVQVGPSGLVVPPADIAAYCAALRRMLTEPKLRQTFSVNALRTATEYSIIHSAESHMQVYLNVLKLGNVLD